MCLSRIKTYSILVGLSLLDSYHHSIPTRGRAHHLSVDGWLKHVWLIGHSQTWVRPPYCPERRPRYEQTDTMYLFRFSPESISIHPSGLQNIMPYRFTHFSQANDYLTIGITVAQDCERKIFHSRTNTFRIATEKRDGSAHPRKLLWE